MLLETVADHEFASAVKDISYEMSKRQYAKNVNQIFDQDIKKMIENGCHIDQIIPVNGSSKYLILYTADHEY